MTATIQIIQPHWAGPDAEDHLAQFWANVDSDPLCVVTVAVYDGRAWEMNGIFSTKAGALAWASEQGAPCVLLPKRVDCPDWGNATVQ